MNQVQKKNARRGRGNDREQHSTRYIAMLSN